ncbi:DUF6326 family protein [Meiothermus granaticius]|uniref:DoxX-like family protein n=1 Tax=Meiothermus granaticius NBRC 107808 TaxID=1227551 RepID=A0A399F8P0_9DEIN|nr:DUF6326 family protein [Meiothermus granaticius]RIH91629.1 hypothetical protein Mgrana_02439 [Meiothermus granaticius NBRC 107808]GEM88499.1 hypothetical protein MGR01S_31240 [Meiothermus granaticius NBRC 107808]
MEATRIQIAALWTVVMFNIAFADIIGFIHPGTLQQIMEGSLEFPVTPGLLLLFSVLTQVPIAMIFLSLLLPRQANRWANTLAAVLTTLYVVGGGSATPSYFFFATVEVLCMAAIVGYVWRGKQGVV